jgi:hypothetical protein
MNLFLAWGGGGWLGKISPAEGVFLLLGIVLFVFLFDKWVIKK